MSFPASFGPPPGQPRRGVRKRKPPQDTTEPALPNLDDPPPPRLGNDQVAPAPVQPNAEPLDPKLITTEEAGRRHTQHLYMYCADLSPEVRKNFLRLRLNVHVVYLIILSMMTVFLLNQQFF